MATKITTSISVAIDGDGTLTATFPQSLEVYTKIALAIKDKGKPEVDVNPGDKKLRLLFITADAYPTETGKLTFTVDGGSAQDLYAPLLLVETGASALLGAAKKLTFENKTGKEAKVTILVGRDADITA